MKFTVNTIDFKNAITKAEKALAKKTYTPALENVNIAVSNNTCIVYGTDLNNFVKTEIPALSIGSNEISFILFDTKSLMKALKFFKDFEIEFEVLEHSVKVKCGDKKANLKTLDTEYPEFPIVDNEIQVKETTAKRLSERYKLINYAVAKAHSNPVLDGVHFNEDDMVACDGFRLAINKDDSLCMDNSFTISSMAVKLCSDILDGKVVLRTNDKYAEIRDSDTSIITRLFDCEYVNYKNVIPTNHNKLVIDVKQITENLKYLKTFVEVASKGIAWRNNRLKLNTSSGEYEAELDIDGSFDYTIGFNVSYMLDCLSQFKDDVSVFMGDSKVTPIVFEQGDNKALVLPVRMECDPFENESKTKDVA